MFEVRRARTECGIGTHRRGQALGSRTFSDLERIDGIEVFDKIAKRTITRGAMSGRIVAGRRGAGQGGVVVVFVVGVGVAVRIDLWHTFGADRMAAGDGHHGHAVVRVEAFVAYRTSALAHDVRARAARSAGDAVRCTCGGSEGLVGVASQVDGRVGVALKELERKGAE